MKTVAKVFIIISACLTFYLIFPVVICVLSIKKMDTASNASDLKVLGIITLLFCSTIGGILMLCMKDDDLKDNPNISISKSKDDYISNIKELKQLYDSGALTEAEYNKLKAEQLNR